jgi:hypothetical protein
MAPVCRRVAKPDRDGAYPGLAIGRFYREVPIVTRGLAGLKSGQFLGGDQRAGRVVVAFLPVGVLLVIAVR